MPIDADYMAQDDAYILARAEEIKSNPDRLRRAQNKLNEIAEQKQNEAAAARRAAGSIGGSQRRAEKPRTGANPGPSTPSSGNTPPRTSASNTGGFFNTQRGK